MTKYPENCKPCSGREKCKQAKFMFAGTEPVQGYVSCADLWCEEHAPKSEDTESAGYYPESDTPMHCSECGRPLQCTLTDYGVDYVRESTNGDGGCCIELWPALFAESLCV